MEPEENLEITFKGLKENADSDNNTYYTLSPTKKNTYSPTKTKNFTKRKQPYFIGKRHHTRKRYPNKVWINNTLKKGGRRKRKTRRTNKKRKGSKRR